MLMLLRAAVLRQEAPQVWVQKLRKKETDLGLIQALEAGEKAGAAPPISGVARSLSHSLLGTGDPDLPKRPADAYGYGDVAWAAVSSADATSRQTAALALAALPDGLSAALVRLKLALEARWNGLPRVMRGAELYGNLAESAPGEDTSSGSGPVSKEIGRQPAAGRIAIHLWRGLRRFIANRQWIAWTTLGGAFGAGLGLGIERLIVGLLANAPGANLGTIFFALNSYWGFLLIALTGFLMALAGPVFLRERERVTFLQKMLLGMLGFGLANLLVVLLNGGSLSKVPVTILMGFVAGAAISVPLAMQQASPEARLRPAIWAAGLAGVAVFSAIQGLFVAFPGLGAGISTALSGGFFFSYFDHWNWIRAVPDWDSLLSLADAFFSGFAILFGALAGRRLAEKWFQRWQEMVNRYSD
jgi:hypothetical protein